jgi:hypothetical protein
VNIINTISSIAQHYGVGLDVVRTDQESDAIIAEMKNGINTTYDYQIKDNMRDHAMTAMDSFE